jgi:hypothetical protein
MKRNRETLRPSQRTPVMPTALDLPPDRAFVLHLDVRAQPPRRLVGRVEHITSGQVARVASVRELLVFFADVLRDHVRGKRAATYPPAQATLRHADGEDL